MIDKEILWEKPKKSTFDNIVNVIKMTNLISVGINFPNHYLKINVDFDNSAFESSLKEKFVVTDSERNVPTIVFVKYKNGYDFPLPYRNYGYVSSDAKKVIVFGESFGVFKSVISGFASLQMEQFGYFPIHGSAMVCGNHGVIFTGGYDAGKTTALINLTNELRNCGKKVKILTDDWAVVKFSRNSYVAKTFDPTISLKLADLQQNPHLCFKNHRQLIELLTKKGKASFSPTQLYDESCSCTTMKIDTIIYLDANTENEAIDRIGAQHISKMIVDAAYHYPFTNREQVTRHLDFWQKAAEKIKFLSFARGRPGHKLKNLGSLSEVVK